MFLAIMRALHGTLPCTENFFNKKAEFIKLRGFSNMIFD